MTIEVALVQLFSENPAAGADPSPDAESNSSAYQRALANCSATSGIQAALDELLA